MKKVLIIIMALVISASITGCNSFFTSNNDTNESIEEKTSDTKDEKDSDENSEKDEDSSSADSEKEKADLNSTTDSKTDSADTVSDNEEIDAADLLGVKDGNLYKNQTLDMGIQLPDGWRFYTDDEMSTIYGVVYDTLDENLSEQLKNAPIIYDMFAQDPISGNNININIENLNILAAQLYDEKEYVEIASSQYAYSMEQMGCSDINTNITSVTIAGSEHSALDTTYTLNGRSCYQKIIAVKKGTYMYVITITTLDSDSMDDLVSSFYSL